MERTRNQRYFNESAAGQVLKRRTHNSIVVLMAKVKGLGRCVVPKSGVEKLRHLVWI